MNGLEEHLPASFSENGRKGSSSLDLATMPLYVRAGAVIPLGPIKQDTGEKVEAPLTLQIYFGDDGSFTLYEDDGATFNYRKGEWMGIKIRWNDRKRRLTLNLAEGSHMLPPLRRKIEVRLASEKATREAIFEERPVQIQL